MGENRSNHSKWKVLMIQVLWGGAAAVILTRIASRKYQDGYLLIFCWFLLITIPLIVTISIKKLNSQIRNWNSILLYFVLVFFSLLIFQPIIWEFAQIGYLPFFRNSLFVLMIFEIFLLFPLIQDYKSFKITGVNDQNLIEKSPSKIDEVLILNKVQAEQIKQSLGHDRITKVIDQLLSVNGIPATVNNNLILIKQQWTNLEKESKLGLITYEDARVRRAQITNALLSIVDSADLV